jgi:cellobiose phosphorylase
MKYGYFDEKTCEYVITDPCTPVKWINYIGTLGFGGFVDHTGGAVICKGDPSLNRITKYIAQLPASDFKGETLYLRFTHAGRFKVFSPFFVPTLDNCDLFECHVGLGYTRIISEFYGIRTEATIFIPRGSSREVRNIKITNLNRYTLSLDAVPVVEYTHPDSLKQLTNADWVPQTMQSALVEQDLGLKILLQYPFMFRDIKVNYFTSNMPVSSFETDRKVFLGRNEYGTWANPGSLSQDEFTNSLALRGDNIAALLHHMGEVQPGETRQLITQLGQEGSIDHALTLIDEFRKPEVVEQSLEELAVFWNEYLSRCQVQTPDVSMNQMLNVHNPRQCYITKNWSRYLSMYQLGFGSRGIGFRDSSQDVMGILANAPEEGKDLIRLLLQVQKRNGSAMHQFNPLNMVASAGDAMEMEDRPHYYSDDHLWIVLAVAEYIKETGNADFLEERMPFYEKDKNQRPLESVSVREHLSRAIEFTWKDTGVHGLPLAGFADWNDTVNLPAGAESLFTAHLFGWALLEMIDLMEFLGDREPADKYREYYEAMRSRVNQHAWDGEWYIRYFDHESAPLGSKENEHGQIYTNAQSWAVLSGFAPADRAQKALQSVYTRLNTRNGIKLSTPGFNGFDPGKGGVTTYPPGAKENGGIFLHANPWVIIAESILGNGVRAFEYYTQINPASKNDNIDEYECEPYVYAQNILGDEHPQFGLGRNSWLSGTASWMYQAAVKYILGIRPAYTGLKVDPCIPSHWDGFSVRRWYRGSWYAIDVKNPQGVNKGICGIKVDGRELRGNILPVFDDKKEHQVDVVLGATVS